MTAPKDLHPPEKTPVQSQSSEEPARRAAPAISPDMMDIPVRKHGLLGEFLDFLVHNKAWWMTPIIVVILLMVAFILFAESSPVLPFVYILV